VEGDAVLSGAVVCLTGGMAAGKTALASILRRKGAAYYPLDEAAHALYLPGRPVHWALVRAFGRGILGAGKTIDRGALGNIAFRREDALRRLDAIVHPALRCEAREALARMRRRNVLTVVEAGPLLFDLGLYRAVDCAVLVTAPYGERVRRLAEARGLPASRARALLRAMEPVEKALNARFRTMRRAMEVDTGGPPGSLERRAEGILRRCRNGSPRD